MHLTTDRRTILTLTFRLRGSILSPLGRKEPGFTKLGRGTRLTCGRIRRPEYPGRGVRNTLRTPPHSDTPGSALGISLIHQRQARI